MNLKDKHKGKDCLLLGSGPSLADFSKDQISEIAEGKIVFSIKQAIRRYFYTDYHFLNGNNIEYYSYYGHKPHVVVALANNNQIPYLKSIANSFFIIEQNQDYSRSLSATLDFESNTLDNKPFTRIWGPGILWSTVLFFVEHMGFKNLYTVGVDLAPDGAKTRDHFYTEKVINPAFALSDEECNNEIELSRHFYQWLQSKGVAWYVLSYNSYLHKDIPRMGLGALARK